MRILASHDGGSGCAWYRMIVPLEAVAEHSKDTSVTFRCGGVASMDDPPPQLKVDDVEGQDVMIAQRVNAYEGLGLWRRWNTPWRRTVYENDDDVFNITHDNLQAYDAYKSGSELREAVKRYCDTASLITVSTPYLGDMHREMSSDARVPVEVLPNYINSWVLDLKRDENHRPRIGWMGGASHVRDIEQAANSVKRFMKRHRDWDLFVSGTDYRRSFKVEANRSFYIPWLHVTNDPKMFYRAIDFDIGICPLLDTQFARSKSPIKALEYSARGVVPVCSDVEPYHNFIHDGVDGFLVKTEHEWLNRLETLANDEDLRIMMGAAAKENARKYLIEDHWQEWVNAYRMLFPADWTFQG
jgi:glycosyltransferase involved in cell wall biosynthesis